MKSKIILNIDFPNELINKYMIKDDAIIINVPGKAKINRKRFNRLIVNNYEIDFRDYIKSEESTNEEHYGDTVHVFKIDEELMPRYDEEADYVKVCIYVKITWPDGQEPMFIISFHEDEE